MKHTAFSWVACIALVAALGLFLAWPSVAKTHASSRTEAPPALGCISVDTVMVGCPPAP